MREFDAYTGFFISLLVFFIVGFFVLNRTLHFARRYPRLAVGPEIVSRFFGWVPGLLDRAYAWSYKLHGSVLMKGDRLAYARRTLPPASYPAAWRTDIPADLRKPLWHDGRLPNGQYVAELAKREMTDAVLVKLVGTAAFHTLFVIVGLGLLAVAAGIGTTYLPGAQASRSIAPYPVWAAEAGAWMPVLSWYALKALDAVWKVIGTVLSLGLPVALLAFGIWFFSFTTLVRQWWSSVATPLLYPTRDTLLFWKQNASSREHWLRTYNRQVEEATGRLADQPFIPVGKASGILRSRGDDMGPMPNVALGYDGESIRTHTLVLGGTGTGKTRLVIRPLFRRIMEAAWGTAKIGAYVTDGKGTLWRDLLPTVANRDDVVVVGPGEDHYGVDLVQGMTPLEIATTFKAVGGQVSGKPSDDFWPESASLLLMHAATIARILDADDETVAEWVEDHSCRPYSLIGISLLAADQSVAEAAIASARAIGTANAGRQLSDEEEQQFADAFESIDWFEGQFLPMALETKSSIIGNVNVVLGKLRGAPVLSNRFCRGTFEKVVDVDHALKGGIVMVAVGETDHGMAGKVVTVWLKSRLYILARRRLLTDPKGCRENSCAMIADEFQMLVTTGADSDSSFWNIARETGVFLIAATQSLAALKQVVGDDATANIVNLLRSKIVLKTEEISTMEFVQKLSGTVQIGNEVPEWFFPTQEQRERVHGGARTVRPEFANVSMRDIWPSRLDYQLKPHSICRDPLPSHPGLTDQKGAYEAYSDKLRAAVADKRKQEESYLTSNLKTEPKVTMNELLMGSGMAFAMIQRAGGTRMDIIDLEAAA